MRNLLFIFMLILIGQWNCHGQTVLDTDGLNNLDNVFLYSLKEYCNSLDSIKTKVVYVRPHDFIGENWPKKINGFEIKYLDLYEYDNIVRQRSGIKTTIVEIGPLECRNGLFSVSILLSLATYKEGMVFFYDGGELIIYFEYDNEKKGLIYKAHKWKGT